MKKFIEIAKGFVVTLAIAAISIFSWELSQDDDNIVIVEAHDSKLISIEELQKALGVKPDGILGKETIEAWDKAVCEQYAQKIQDRRI